MKKLNQIILSILSIAVVSSFAKETEKNVILDGIFIGANTFYFSNERPDEMSWERLSIESDFVLVLPDGNNHFVDKLPKHIKMEYYNTEVRVMGNLNENGTVIADKLQAFKNDKWETVWDLKTQEENDA